MYLCKVDIDNLKETMRNRERIAQVRLTGLRRMRQLLSSSTSLTRLSRARGELFNSFRVSLYNKNIFDGIDGSGSRALSAITRSFLGVLSEVTRSLHPEPQDRNENSRLVPMPLSPVYLRALSAWVYRLRPTAQEHLTFNQSNCLEMLHALLQLRRPLIRKLSDFKGGSSSTSSANSASTTTTTTTTTSTATTTTPATSAGAAVSTTTTATLSVRPQANSAFQAVSEIHSQAWKTLVIIATQIATTLPTQPEGTDNSVFKDLFDAKGVATSPLLVKVFGILHHELRRTVKVMEWLMAVMKRYAFQSNSNAAAAATLPATTPGFGGYPAGGQPYSSKSFYTKSTPAVSSSSSLQAIFLSEYDFHKKYCSDVLKLVTELVGLVGTDYVANKEWMRSLVALLDGGKFPDGQSVIRLFSLVLPGISPGKADALLWDDDDAGTTVSSPTTTEEKPSALKDESPTEEEPTNKDRTEDTQVAANTFSHEKFPGSRVIRYFFHLVAKAAWPAESQQAGAPKGPTRTASNQLIANESTALLRCFYESKKDADDEEEEEKEDQHAAILAKAAAAAAASSDATAESDPPEEVEWSTVLVEFINLSLSRLSDLASADRVNGSEDSKGKHEHDHEHRGHILVALKILPSPLPVSISGTLSDALDSIIPSQFPKSLLLKYWEDRVPELEEEKKEEKKEEEEKEKDKGKKNNDSTSVAPLPNPDFTGVFLSNVASQLIKIFSNNVECLRGIGELHPRQAKNLFPLLVFVASLPVRVPRQILNKLPPHVAINAIDVVQLDKRRDALWAQAHPLRTAEVKAQKAAMEAMKAAKEARAAAAAVAEAASSTSPPEKKKKKKRKQPKEIYMGETPSPTTQKPVSSGKKAPKKVANPSGFGALSPHGNASSKKFGTYTADKRIPGLAMAWFFDTAKRLPISKNQSIKGSVDGYMNKNGSTTKDCMGVYKPAQLSRVPYIKNCVELSCTDHITSALNSEYNRLTMKELTLSCWFKIKPPSHHPEPSTPATYNRSSRGGAKRTPSSSSRKKTVASGNDTPSSPPPPSRSFVALMGSYTGASNGITIELHGTHTIRFVVQNVNSKTTSKVQGTLAPKKDASTSSDDPKKGGDSSSKGGKKGAASASDDVNLGFQDGEWHLVTVTRGKKKLSLYMDGVLLGTARDTTGEFQMNRYGMMVGRDGRDPLEFLRQQRSKFSKSAPVLKGFEGSVALPMAWNVALREDQVVKLWRGKPLASISEPLSLCPEAVKEALLYGLPRTDSGRDPAAAVISFEETANLAANETFFDSNSAAHPHQMPGGRAHNYGDNYNPNYGGCSGGGYPTSSHPAPPKKLPVTSTNVVFAVTAIDRALATLFARKALLSLLLDNSKSEDMKEESNASGLGSLKLSDIDADMATIARFIKLVVLRDSSTLGFTSADFSASTTASFTSNKHALTDKHRVKRPPFTPKNETEKKLLKLLSQIMSGSNGGSSSSPLGP